MTGAEFLNLAGPGGIFVEFFNALVPEIILITGACLVLFIGAPRSTGRRDAAGWFTLAIIAGAWISAATLGRHGWTTAEFSALSGLSTGPVVSFVRLLTLSVGALLVLANWSAPAAEERNEYFCMVLLSMSGVHLVAAANDLILLFLALELVSVPTYVLVAVSRQDIRAQEAGGKYFFLGALAAALLAYGLSFLYGATGTTTMFGSGTVSSWLAAGHPDALGGYAQAGLLLALGALCFKLAAVPFHGYVADVYEGAAAPLAAALAFLPKLAGAIGIMQLLSLISWHLPAALFWVLWIVAAATMTAGNVLALMQTNVKRMLAYSSVAHSGYLLIGVVVGPRSGSGPLGDGLAAVLFYVAVYGVMNLGAFAFVACLSGEEEAAQREHFEGCARRHPLAAAGLTVCLLSLIGLPPTAGFMGKLYLFASAFASSEADFGRALVLLAVIGAVNSAIGAAYYLRVVSWCWCEPWAQTGAAPRGPGLRAVVVLCAAAMLVLFVWPQGLRRAAEGATRATRQMAGKASLTEAQPQHWELGTRTQLLRWPSAD